MHSHPQSWYPLLITQYSLLFALAITLVVSVLALTLVAVSVPALTLVAVPALALTLVAVPALALTLVAVPSLTLTLVAVPSLTLTLLAVPALALTLVVTTLTPDKEHLLPAIAPRPLWYLLLTITKKVCQTTPRFTTLKLEGISNKKISGFFYLVDSEKWFPAILSSVANKILSINTRFYPYFIGSHDAFASWWHFPVPLLDQPPNRLCKPQTSFLLFCQN